MRIFLFLSSAFRNGLFIIRNDNRILKKKCEKKTSIDLKNVYFFFSVGRFRGAMKRKNDDEEEKALRENSDVRRKKEFCIFHHRVGQEKRRK